MTFFVVSLIILHNKHIDIVDTPFDALVFERQKQGRSRLFGGRPDIQPLAESPCGSQWSYNRHTHLVVFLIGFSLLGRQHLVLCQGQCGPTGLHCGRKCRKGLLGNLLLSLAGLGLTFNGISGLRFADGQFDTVGSGRQFLIHQLEGLRIDCDIHRLVLVEQRTSQQCLTPVFRMQAQFIHHSPAKPSRLQDLLLVLDTDR